MATKNILMVAFQFPPMSGSSGLLRVLKFCRYLPDYGWTPTVITANSRMYEEVDERQLALIPSGLEVIRASGLDTRRDLSIRGRYPRLLALPDRWVSWSFAAILKGLRVIFQKKIDVVFTTFPIASAVWVGLALHRLTRKPWIVDFRDPLTEDHHPRDRTTWRVWRWLEQQAMRRASLLLFTARSTLRMYRQRYPEIPGEKFLLLPNGYDEEDFIHVHGASASKPAHPVHLLHSGLVYPEERDPRAFFRALARLHEEGKISAETLNLSFRAAGFEDTYNPAIQELGLSGIVHFLPRIPYTQALQECADTDALLVMQAANCDHQIPAKTYEYLRLGKPILGLTTDGGDTAALLREVGGATVTDLHDENAIYESLPRFLAAVADGSHPLPSRDLAARYARQNLARELTNHLNRLNPDCEHISTLMEDAPGGARPAADSQRRTHDVRLP